MTKLDDDTTHFGFRKVSPKEKTNLVGEVFKSVAGKYDVMNDLMSFGLHRLWKQQTIEKANPRQGQRILDVASGTGDLAKAFSKRVGKTGYVVMTDINEAMLQVGLERLTDAGIMGNLACVQADAEQLPFIDNYFDCATIAFGLRNVTEKEKALKSLYRVIKPGGKLLILEFSKPPTALLQKAYDLYSFHVIPKIGKLVANDSESYQYLVESIRMHPDQETLKTKMLDAGFAEASYQNLSGGIVALHQGIKF